MSETAPTKPWYLSRTIWANALTSGVAILGAIAGQEWIAAHPEAVAVLALATSVLNVVLRFVTTEGVK